MKSHRIVDDEPSNMPAGKAQRAVSQVVASTDGSVFAAVTYTVPGSFMEVGTTQSSLIKVDAEGATLWEISFGTSGFDLLTTLAPASDGGGLAAVRMENPNAVTFSKSTVTRFDADGNVLSQDEVEGLRLAAPAPDGGFVALHDGPLHLTLSRFGQHPFHVELAGFTFASAIGPAPFYVAADGSTYFVGLTEGEASVGGQTIPGPGGSMVFVRISESGQVLTAKAFSSLGTYDAPVANAVVEGPGGQVIVSGIFDKTFDFGLGPIGNPDTYNAFVLALSPDGVPAWSRAVGDWGTGENGSALPLPVVASSACGLAVVAHSASAITIGSGTVPAATTDNPDEASFVGFLSTAGDLVSSRRFEATTRAMVLMPDGSLALGGLFRHLRIGSVDVASADFFRAEGFLVRTSPL